MEIYLQNSLMALQQAHPLPPPLLICSWASLRKTHHWTIKKAHSLPEEIHWWWFWGVVPRPWPWKGWNSLEKFPRHNEQIWSEMGLFQEICKCYFLDMNIWIENKKITYVPVLKTPQPLPLHSTQLLPLWRPTQWPGAWPFHQNPHSLLKGKRHNKRIKSFHPKAPREGIQDQRFVSPFAICWSKCWKLYPQVLFWQRV